MDRNGLSVIYRANMDAADGHSTTTHLPDTSTSAGMLPTNTYTTPNTHLECDETECIGGAGAGRVGEAVQRYRPKPTHKAALQTHEAVPQKKWWGERGHGEVGHTQPSNHGTRGGGESIRGTPEQPPVRNPPGAPLQIPAETWGGTPLNVAERNNDDPTRRHGAHRSGIAHHRQVVATGRSLRQHATPNQTVAETWGGATARERGGGKTGHAMAMAEPPRELNPVGMTGKRGTIATCLDALGSPGHGRRTHRSDPSSHNHDADGTFRAVGTQTRFLTSAAARNSRQTTRR